MKKKLIFIGLLACMALPLGACEKEVTSSPDGSENSVHTHAYVEHGAVAADCENAGNEQYYTCEGCDAVFDKDKKEIEEVPTLEALGHGYVLVTEKDGSCSVKGESAHYTCEDCDKLFDLTKTEITSVAGDYDASVHTGTVALSVQAQPAKTTYTVGERFDPTGMVVVYKCGDCAGSIVDNQFLSYSYQTDGADSFADGDTKITVHFNGLSFDVAISVGKAQANISGVAESYETVCGVAPQIDAISNLPDSALLIAYYDGETEITSADLVAGKTYTAKVYIESTDTVEGAEVFATVNVSHERGWKADEADENKLVYKCNCGDGEGAYVMDNQSIFVDSTDMSVDLSKLVVGAENVSVKSIQQILLVNNGTKVDIEGTNEGMVYTFDLSKYEKTAFAEVDGEIVYYTPYELALSVVYTVDGVDCEATVVAKYVDKVIRNAEDLKALAYTGKPTAGEGGTMITGQYVLAGDIDASGLEIGATNPAWQAAVGFCGVFDGNGHTISNLTVGSHGLFGSIGYNAKIQNVTFENLNVASGSYGFAFAMRNAAMTNVTVEFNVNSSSYQLAYSANACEFENVTIVTEAGVAPFLIEEKAENPLPATITLNAFPQFTVTFNTDGGNDISPVAVTTGKTVSAPETPYKTSNEYDYEFLGWYYKETVWDFNTPITDNVELIAKWKAVKKVTAADVVALITALPDSVTVPENLDVVPSIVEAKAAYDKLSETNKAQVSNYEKLEALLVAVQKCEISLTFGNFTDSGETNEYGKVYKFTQGWSSETDMGAFNPNALGNALPSGYESLCFWIYNPNASDVEMRFASEMNGWNPQGEYVTTLAAGAWTKVEVTPNIIAEGANGTWFVNVSAGAKTSGWKISSMFAVLAE